MSISATFPPRALAAAAVTLLIALGGTMLVATPAEADSNSKHGNCIFSYNYADPGSDYLYALTEAKSDAFPEPCAHAEVRIYNDGCSGSLVASESGYGQVSVSATVPSSWWVNPCSRHFGDSEAHMLPFIY